MRLAISTAIFLALITNVQGANAGMIASICGLAAGGNFELDSKVRADQAIPWVGAKPLVHYLDYIADSTVEGKSFRDALTRMTGANQLREAVPAIRESKPQLYSQIINRLEALHGLVLWNQSHLTAHQNVDVFRAVVGELFQFNLLRTRLKNPSLAVAELLASTSRTKEKVLDLLGHGVATPDLVSPMRLTLSKIDTYAAVVRNDRSARFLGTAVQLLESETEFGTLVSAYVNQVRLQWVLHHDREGQCTLKSLMSRYDRIGVPSIAIERLYIPGGYENAHASITHARKYAQDLPSRLCE